VPTVDAERSSATETSMPHATSSGFSPLGCWALRGFQHSRGDVLQSRQSGRQEIHIRPHGISVLSSVHSRMTNSAPTIVTTGDNQRTVPPPQECKVDHVADAHHSRCVAPSNARSLRTAPGAFLLHPFSPTPRGRVERTRRTDASSPLDHSTWIVVCGLIPRKSAWSTAWSHACWRDTLSK